MARDIKQLESFVQTLSARHGAAKVRLEAGAVWVTATAARLPLDGAPPDTDLFITSTVNTVAVIGPDAEFGRVDVRFANQSDRSAHITFEVKGIRHMDVSSLGVSSVTLAGGNTRSIRPTGPGPFNLDIAKTKTLLLGTAGADPPVSSLSIKLGTSHQFDLIEFCGGQIQLMEKVSTKRTVLTEDTKVSFGSLQLGVLVGTGMLTLSGGTAAILGRDEGHESPVIRLEATSLAIGSPQKDTEPLVVGGEGDIKARGRVNGLDLTGCTKVDLQVEQDSVVLGLKGAMTLRADRRSYVSGTDDGAFAPREITAIDEGVRITNLSPWNLGSVADLAVLESCDRFSLALPRRSKAMRDLQDTAAVGSGENESGVDLNEKAQFFAQLSAMLAEQHDSANLQSQARYLALRARREAARERGWNRERFLLWLYWLVGYGERILRPLGWVTAAAIMTTVVLDRGWSTPFVDAAGTSISPSLSDTLWQVVMAPFSFFRLGGALVGDGIGPQATLLIYRAFAIVLIFLALAATRRIAVIAKR